MNAKLVATDGLGESREFALRAWGSYLVGRSRRADIVIKHPSVSRRHCKLSCVPPGKWLVTDVGSSNGTFINSRPVSTEPLADGDSLRLGHVTLVFELMTEAGAPALIAVEPRDPGDSDVADSRVTEVRDVEAAAASAQPSRPLR